VRELFLCCFRFYWKELLQEETGCSESAAAASGIAAAAGCVLASTARAGLEGQGGEEEERLCVEEMASNGSGWIDPLGTLSMSLR
jgi:hypothetical protein